jgi:hypothetical protein
MRVLKCDRSASFHRPCSEVLGIQGASFGITAGPRSPQLVPYAKRNAEKSIDGFSFDASLVEVLFLLLLLLLLLLAFADAGTLEIEI